MMCATRRRLCSMSTLRASMSPESHRSTYLRSSSGDSGLGKEPEGGPSLSIRNALDSSIMNAPASILQHHLSLMLYSIRLPQVHFRTYLYRVHVIWSLCCCLMARACFIKAFAFYAVVSPKSSANTIIHLLLAWRRGKP